MSCIAGRRDSCPPTSSSDRPHQPCGELEGAGTATESPIAAEPVPWTGQARRPSSSFMTTASAGASRSSPRRNRTAFMAPDSSGRVIRQVMRTTVDTSGQENPTIPSHRQVRAPGRDRRPRRRHYCQRPYQRRTTRKTWPHRPAPQPRPKNPCRKVSRPHMGWCAAPARPALCGRREAVLVWDGRVKRTWALNPVCRRGWRYGARGARHARRCQRQTGLPHP
jgi:hypothetical protein